MKLPAVVGLVLWQLASEALGAAVRWVTRREKPFPMKPKASPAPAPAKPTPTVLSSVRTRTK